MMFCLKLTTAKTMQHYDKMAQQIFSPTVMGINLQKAFGHTEYLLGKAVLKYKAFRYPSRFPPEPLEKAIAEVVGSRNVKLLEKPESPKM